MIDKLRIKKPVKLIENYMMNETISDFRLADAPWFRILYVKSFIRSMTVDLIYKLVMKAKDIVFKI